MSGYTPVFKSVFQGSLCGQYPDTAAWLFLLALADKGGVIDMTPQFISGITGMPLADLLACIERFMQPDPMSRSKEKEGRRLELIDPARQWGWRIVNFGLYREKARLMSKDSARTASGKDADRKRMEREKHEESPAVPRSPPKSPKVPLSDSDSDSDSDSEKNPPTPQRGKTVSRETEPPAWWLDFKLAYPSRAGDQGWRKAQRAAHARISEGHTSEEIIAGAKRYAAYCEATGSVGTEFVKQAATFLGPEKGFAEPWIVPVKKANGQKPEPRRSREFPSS